MTHYQPKTPEEKLRFIKNWCDSCERYPDCEPIKQFKRNGLTKHWLKSDNYEPFCNLYKEKVESYETNTLNLLDND